MEVIVRKQYLKDLRKVPVQVFAASDEALDKLKVAETLQQSVLEYKKCKGKKG